MDKHEAEEFAERLRNIARSVLATLAPGLEPGDIVRLRRDCDALDAVLCEFEDACDDLPEDGDSNG